VAAVTADYQGWGAIYLGPSLPSDAIARAVRLSRARAVGLSIVYPEGPYGLEAELKKLRLLLPREVVLFTGGRAVPAYRSVLNEIEAIRLQISPLFALHSTCCLASRNTRKVHKHKTVLRRFSTFKSTLPSHFYAAA
jgi:hypothetical protein